MSEFIKEKINTIVKNKKKAKILSDIDHPFGTKRPPIDTNYFETYNRSNVEIVNVKKDPIIKIVQKGIITKNNKLDLDIIVFATGFDAMTGSLVNLNIFGKNNLSLKELWAKGPLNYLGIQIPGFPNLFTITGPGSPSVLSNMPRSIEQHVEWIGQCINFIKKHNFKSIEASKNAANLWISEVNSLANDTLLPKAKHSWYLGANIPGKPRVFMPYAGGLPKYRKKCDEVKNRNYEGFNLS